VTAILSGKILFIFIALFTAVVCCGQVDVHQVAERADKHYNSLQTLQADFTEIYRGAGMSRTESGTLFLKRPGRMRWEYREPTAKLFLTDGRTAWFYLPGERQVRKTAMKKLDDLRSPIAYMLGRTKLEKEFQGLSLAPDIRPTSAGNVVLRGVPRNMNDRVSDVVLEIAPDGSFQRLTANEMDGSSTEFRFTNQKENSSIPDARFKFTPPPGVETVEAGELAQ
jgi:outer membrane lipoprotein carrier protein